MDLLFTPEMLENEKALAVLNDLGEWIAKSGTAGYPNIREGLIVGSRFLLESILISFPTPVQIRFNKLLLKII